MENVIGMNGNERVENNYFNSQPEKPEIERHLEERQWWRQHWRQLAQWNEKREEYRKMKIIIKNLECGRWSTGRRAKLRPARSPNKEISCRPTIGSTLSFHGRLASRVNKANDIIAQGWQAKLLDNGMRRVTSHIVLNVIVRLTNVLLRVIGWEE